MNVQVLNSLGMSHLHCHEQSSSYFLYEESGCCDVVNFFFTSNVHLLYIMDIGIHVLTIVNSMGEAGEYNIQ